MRSKVTVTHFLNKRVKPVVDSLDQKERYPIYCQVTYKRKNTQFPFNFLKYSEHIKYSAELRIEIFTDDEYESFMKRNKDLFDYEINIIEQTIRYENKKYRDSFTLKRISERTDVYTFNFLNLVTLEVNDNLHMLLFGSMKTVFRGLILQSVERMDFLDKISFVERNYNKKIRNKITKAEWNEIYTYYLILSFYEGRDNNLTSLANWVFDDGFARFSIYLKDKLYLKEDNPYLEKIEAFEHLEVKACIEFVQKNIDYFTKLTDSSVKVTLRETS